MKNFIKISVTFLTIFLIFPIASLAKEQILPLPKPNVSTDIKKTTAEKKNIYPKEKPKQKNEDEKTETVQDDIKLKDSEKGESFIYPKKKPILVQKKITKIVPKSTILSKKDFKIAIKAFEAIDKKNGKLH